MQPFLTSHALSAGQDIFLFLHEIYFQRMLKLFASFTFFSFYLYKLSSLSLINIQINRYLPECFFFSRGCFIFILRMFLWGNFLQDIFCTFFFSSLTCWNEEESAAKADIEKIILVEFWEHSPQWVRERGRGVGEREGEEFSLHRLPIMEHSKTVCKHKQLFSQFLFFFQRTITGRTSQLDTDWTYSQFEQKNLNNQSDMYIEDLINITQE